MADKLTARVCVFCRKPKGTIAFRQDRATLDAAEIPHVAGAFFAHLKCMQFWRRLNATQKAGR
jgi:hypothetical protein